MQIDGVKDSKGVRALLSYSPGKLFLNHEAIKNNYLWRILAKKSIKPRIIGRKLDARKSSSFKLFAVLIGLAGRRDYNLVPSFVAKG